jgi:hypothetical protein
MAAGSGAGVKLEQLKAKGVIPDVVEDVGSPLLDMRVGYKEIEVTNGVAIRVKQSQTKPHVEFRGSGFGDAEDKFTLLMVDPDAPRPEAPSNRNWLHWIVVNIPGSISPSQGAILRSPLTFSYRLAVVMVMVSYQSDYRYVSNQIELLHFRGPGFQPCEN